MLKFFLFFFQLSKGCLSVDYSAWSVGDAHKYVTQSTFVGDLDQKDHQQLKEARLFLARRGSRGSSGTRYPYRGGRGAGRGRGTFNYNVGGIEAFAKKIFTDARGASDKAGLRKTGACFTCKKTGHMSRNCPDQ